jgi:hypothetical protein
LIKGRSRRTRGRRAQLDKSLVTGEIQRDDHLGALKLGESVMTIVERVVHGREPGRSGPVGRRNG